MKPAITKPALVTILESRRVRCASRTREKKMIRNTMMLLPILAMTTATMATAALTEHEKMTVVETVAKVVKKNRLNKTDEMTVKITDKEMEEIMAAIKAGDKAEQERIVREIVAAQTNQ